jgi:hypothetical protein
MNKHEKVFIGILFRNCSENCSKWFNIERFDRKGKRRKYMSIKQLSIHSKYDESEAIKTSLKGDIERKVIAGKNPLLFAKKGTRSSSRLLYRRD